MLATLAPDQSSHRSGSRVHRRKQSVHGLDVLCGWRYELFLLFVREPDAPVAGRIRLDTGLIEHGRQALVRGRRDWAIPSTQTDTGAAGGKVSRGRGV
jgi:hypothetical protein